MSLHVEEKNVSKPKKGKIILIIGPMCAGKTSELLRIARRFRVRKMRVMLVNPACNTRDDVLRVSTHNKDSESAVSVNLLSEVWLHEEAFDVLAVDEGQFIPDLATECDRLADAGKIVIVSGLSGTFDRVPFPTIESLSSRAEDILHFKAVCVVCGEDAAFSKLLDTSGVGADSVKIGGPDLYEPRCRNCWTV